MQQNSENSFKRCLKSQLEQKIKFQKFLQTFFKISIQNQTNWHCLVLVIIKTKMDPTRFFLYFCRNCRAAKRFSRIKQDRNEIESIFRILKDNRITSLKFFRFFNLHQNGHRLTITKTQNAQKNNII